MKTYAYGLSNYYDDTVVNDGTAISYTKKKEKEFFNIYNKYVDFFTSNEVSLTDKIFDMSVMIGLVNVLEMSEYFSSFNSEESKRKMSETTSKMQNGKKRGPYKKRNTI